MVRRIVSSVAGLGPAARVPARLRRDYVIFTSLVGAVVALWAARDLVKIRCRVRDGETPQSGLDPPRLHPVTGPRARGREGRTQRETTCDRGDPAISVETPPACLCSPPKAQMSGRQPSDRRSVRACAGGGPRSAQVVRVHSVSCGSATGR